MTEIIAIATPISYKYSNIIVLFLACVLKALFNYKHKIIVSYRSTIADHGINTNSAYYGNIVLNIANITIIDMHVMQYHECKPHRMEYDPIASDPRPVKPKIAPKVHRKLKMY